MYPQNSLCSCEDGIKTIFEYNGTKVLGLCFRELILGALIPYLIILLGGLYKLYYIWQLRRETKNAKKGKMEPHRQKFFFIKFGLCVGIAFLSQGLVILCIILGDYLSIHLLADILRAIFWGFSILVMIAEYMNRTAHTSALRWFWIVSCMSSGILEYYLFQPVTMCVNGSTYKQHGSSYIFLFQVIFAFQILLAFMGGMGFIRPFRTSYEPAINPRIKKTRKSFSMYQVLLLISSEKWIYIGAIIVALFQGVHIVLIWDSISSIIIHIDCPNNCSRKPSSDDLFQESFLANPDYRLYYSGMMVGLMKLLADFLAGFAGNRTLYTTKSEILQSLVNKNPEYYSSHSVGNLIGHLATDTEKLGVIKTSLPILFSSLAQIITSCIFLWTIHPLPTLLTVALCLFEFFLGIGKSRLLLPLQRKYTDALKYATERGTEILLGHSDVRLFGQEEKELRSYKSNIKQVEKIGKKKDLLGSLFNGAEILLRTAIVASVARFMGNVENALITDFVLIGVNMIFAIQNFQKAGIELLEATEPALVLNEIIDREGPENPDELISINLNKSIYFKSVTFKYPALDQEKAEEEDYPYIFRDLSLKIKKGAKYGLVGPPGAGKSTLLSLLLKNYTIDDDNFNIFIGRKNSVNLKDIDSKYWIKNVALLTQELVMFRGTVKDNVLYGLSEEALNEMGEEDLEVELKKVAKLSNLSSFIRDVGWNLQINEGGTGLPTSVKIRICIARILFKNPSIVLLDEVTSLLDPNSEVEVFSAIENLTMGRTTIMVSQRLVPLARMDKIFVLKAGRIVDEGTHNELLARKGFYKKLWEKQQEELETLSNYEHWRKNVSKAVPKGTNVAALLDLLGRNADKLKESVPEVYALLKKVRPEEKPKATAMYSVSESSSRSQMMEKEQELDESTHLFFTTNPTASSSTDEGWFF